MSDKIKVVVADDSGLMRLIVSDILNSENDIEVIGTAVDGRDAVDKVLKLKPDVLVLDMYMGEYDGSYAVKHILEKQKTPILILSSIGNTNIEPVLEVLGMGAFDYVNKPKDNKARIRQVSDELLVKVRQASKSGTINVVRKSEKANVNQSGHTFKKKLNFEIIVVGASTGGPSAVESLLRNLPKNFPIPVIVAQHMPSNFVPSFVNRLNGIVALDVKMGRIGDEVLPGTVIIAPGSRNMILKKKQGKVLIDFTSKRFKEYNYPSINALFLSVEEIYKARAISVILTGMGKDGALGTEAIFNAGGYTIAQNKETSAVYGMPKAIVDRSVAKSVVSLNEIPGFVVSCLD